MVRLEVQSESIGDLTLLNRRFRPALLCFFRRRITDHVEAEDLTQEVFIRLASRADKSVKSAEAFIFQTAANLLRDRARRHQVRSNYLAALAEEPDGAIDMLDPYRYAEARDQLTAFETHLQDLPERMRQIFLLYRFENVAKQVIADSFRISVSNVEKQVATVMAFLAERMSAAR